MHCIMSSAFCFNLDQSEILLFDNGLTIIRVSDHRNVRESRRFMKKVCTDLCPKMPENVGKTSTKFVEIIHSRYFHKQVDHT